MNDIIDSKNLSDGTKTLYKAVLKRSGIILTDLNNYQKVVDIINELNSNETKKILLNAICKVLEGSETYNVYNDLRNEIKRTIDYDKSDNNKPLPMTYNELMQVPNKINNNYHNYGNIYDKFFVYMHVKYPLRLDYYNVPINTVNTNYMTYDGNILTFYLNAFKNVKSMGKQVITYDDDFIREYFTTVKPEYLLYNKKRNIFSSRIAFGKHIKALFKKYTGIEMTINDIRKIHESHTIQGAGYATMTNRQKSEIHRRLLHTTSTANNAYNMLNLANLF